MTREDIEECRRWVKEGIATQDWAAAESARCTQLINGVCNAALLTLSETKTNSSPNDAIWPPEMELQSMAGGGFQRVKYIRADLVQWEKGTSGTITEYHPGYTFTRDAPPQMPNEAASDRGDPSDFGTPASLAIFNKSPVPIEKARERIAGIEEYLARQKTTSVKEEQAHLVEGSDASLYWHFGYMMALKDIFRLSGKQQDQDGKLFQ